MTKHPPIQIVDKNDKPIRGASMDEAHYQGLTHRIVMTIVVSPEGKILLQKRSPAVVTNPNLWDVASAGHVDEGEDYLTAALRELKEETGVQKADLQELDYFHSRDKYGDRILDRFRKVYKTVVPIDTKFVVPPEEVSEVRWFGKQEVEELLNNSPEQVVPDFIAMLHRYYL